jgi:hypothetical protein
MFVSFPRFPTSPWSPCLKLCLRHVDCLAFKKLQITQVGRKRTFRCHWQISRQKWINLKSINIRSIIIIKQIQSMNLMLNKGNTKIIYERYNDCICLFYLQVGWGGGVVVWGWLYLINSLQKKPIKMWIFSLFFAFEVWQISRQKWINIKSINIRSIIIIKQIQNMNLMLNMKDINKILAKIESYVSSNLVKEAFVCIFQELGFNIHLEFRQCKFAEVCRDTFVSTN